MDELTKVSSDEEEEVFAAGLCYSKYHTGKADLPLNGVKTRLSSTDLLRHKRQPSLDSPTGTPTGPSFTTYRLQTFRSSFSRSSSVSSLTGNEPVSWFRSSHRASYACRSTNLGLVNSKLYPNHRVDICDMFDFFVTF